MNRVGNRAGGSSAGVEVPDRAGEDPSVSSRDARIPDSIAVPNVPWCDQHFVQANQARTG